MSTPDPTDARSGSPDEPHRLVCGRCEAVLEETFPDRAAADGAADDHVPEAHPEYPKAIVLAVPVSVLEDRRADALAIATGAQERVDRGRRDASEEP